MKLLKIQTCLSFCVILGVKDGNQVCETFYDHLISNTTG